MAGRFALILLLSQMLVPAGTMPAALGSGWPLELCPNGVAPAVMAVLHGEGRPHGGHAHQAPQGPGPHPDHGDAWSARCDFASYAAELHVGAPFARVIPASFVAPAPVGRRASPCVAPHHVLHLPRAPPVVRRV